MELWLLFWAFAATAETDDVIGCGFPPQEVVAEVAYSKARMTSEIATFFPTPSAVEREDSDDHFNTFYAT